jgi:tetratricopeptide (TPR) repeat protein
MRRLVLTLCAVAATALWSCRDPAMDKGRAFLQIEDWPRAVASYDGVVARDPENVEARLGLSLARLGLARERAVFGADSVEDWLRVARDLAIVERLDSTQNTRDDRADALFHGCLWLQKHGRPGPAEKLARQAQSADPHHSASAQFLGNLSRSRGDLADAERWFSRALAGDSSYLPAYVSLGEIALSDHDPEGAVVFWQMGLRRDTTNAWFRQRIAEIKDSLGWGSPR